MACAGGYSRLPTSPEKSDPRHEPMLRRLEEIFARHQSGGTVSFEYDTQVYCAQLPPC